MRSLQMFGVFLGHVQGMVAINYYISTQPKRNGQFQGNKPELLVRFQRLFEKKQKKNGEIWRMVWHWGFFVQQGWVKLGHDSTTPQTN